MSRKAAIDLTISSDEDLRSAKWDGRSAKPSTSNHSFRNSGPSNARGTHIVDLTGDEARNLQPPKPKSTSRTVGVPDQSPKRLQKPIPAVAVPEEISSTSHITSHSPTIIKAESSSTSSVSSLVKAKNSPLKPPNKPPFRHPSVPKIEENCLNWNSNGEVSVTQEGFQQPSPSVVAENLLPHDANRLNVPVRLKERMISVDELEKPLQKCLRDRRDDHQYYVKSRLVHARHRHGSLGRTSKGLNSNELALNLDSKVRSPGTYFQSISPFAKLRLMNLDQRGNRAQASDVGRLGQLNMKLTRQGPRSTSVPCLKYKAGRLTVPPFTHYIPTRRNILIEDDKNQTFLPYHGDDAWVDNDYEELEGKILQNREIYQRSNAMTESARAFVPYAEAFLSKMGCSVPLVLRYLLDETKPEIPEEVPEEYIEVWRNRHLHLDDDYYEPGENPSTGTSRDWFRFRPPRKQWGPVFDGLPPPASSREYAAAGMACAIFQRMINFSLWEVIKRHSIVLDSTSQKVRSIEQSSHEDHEAPKPVDPLGTYADLGCLVCYAHECPGHGEFICDDDEKTIRTRINAKSTSPTLPIEKLAAVHANNNSAKPPKALFDDLLGLNQSGTISGEPWVKFRSEESSLKEKEVCSESCFWLKENRSRATSTWSAQEIQIFNTLAAAYIVSRRGACLLALSIDKPCSEIFLKVLQYIELARPSEPSFRNERKLTRPGASKNLDHWLEKSKTWEHHARPPFKPCNHLGKCDSSAGCCCIDEQVSCEKTCMCADSCSKRYRGCNCAARGKVCWENDKCDCYRLNRECDPDLCLNCGAHEVLDPANRYRRDIEGKCTNVSIQRGRPRRTLLGHSVLLASGGVDGWGLYMGEPTRKGDYIGEYVGEVITKEESEARGTIYNKRNMSYLFDLNSTQTLDSTLIGNKFRYINHQAPPHSNCYAKTLFCNTTHRIGMFACRDIKVGEEIWFDYGEGFAAKFNLIKVSDPRTKKRKTGIAQPKIPENAHPLSQGSRKVESQSKAAHVAQGVKENTLKVPRVVVSRSQSTSSPAPYHPSKRRKTDLDEEISPNDASDDVEFEPSSGILREVSSDDSLRESNPELERDVGSDEDETWSRHGSRQGGGSRSRRRNRARSRKKDVDTGPRSQVPGTKIR